MTATTDGRKIEERDFWREHTTFSLQPIAAPSILGLYGFTGATFILSAHLAGWYGNDILTPLVLFPCRGAPSCRPSPAARSPGARTRRDGVRVWVPTEEAT
jgi:hypothetical protein